VRAESGNGAIAPPRPFPDWILPRRRAPAVNTSRGRIRAPEHALRNARGDAIWQTCAPATRPGRAANPLFDPSNVRMENIESRVRAFIRDTFPSPAGKGELSADRSLFDAGVLDSIGVLSLVTWLEQEFGIVVDDEDVIPENIDGVGRLVRYIEAKRAEAGLAG
jgi:acyl carrier protein